MIMISEASERALSRGHSHDAFFYMRSAKKWDLGCVNLATRVPLAQGCKTANLEFSDDLQYELNRLSNFYTMGNHN